MRVDNADESAATAVFTRRGRGKYYLEIEDRSGHRLDKGGRFLAPVMISQAENLFACVAVDLLAAKSMLP
jgi:hypothetical protein